jgi:energy-converting hydrogenase Eha subunit F
VTYVTAFLFLAAIAQLLALLSVILFGCFEVSLLGLPIRARTPQRLLLQFVIASALLLGVSPRARAEAARLARSPIVFALAATILAMWLSLGPLPNSGEARVSGFGLYGILYDYVPGFNGVRVPARYAMIAGLFLAIVAGFGFKQLLSLIPDSRFPIPVSRFLIPVASFLILIEGVAIPMEMNRTWNQNEAMPPGRVTPYREAPPVYARVASLPAGTAITEFPFGDMAWEIRYVYHAAAHRKPITNGYSGSFTPRYKERVARLQHVARNPEAAWDSLKDSGSTHVVLHRNAFANGSDADTVESWLKAHGATEIERFADGDILLKL